MTSIGVSCVVELSLDLGDVADVVSWPTGCVEGVSCVDGIEGILWVTEEGNDGVLALVGVLSIGTGAFGGSFPLFFLLLRVTCVHSLLFSSGLAFVASVVLEVVYLVVSLVVSVVPVVLVELLEL